MNRVLLWGGRSKARIAQEMILAMGGHDVAVIFDGTLERPAFDTTAAFVNDVDRLRETLRTCSHFVVCIGGRVRLCPPRGRAAPSVEGPCSARAHPRTGLHRADGAPWRRLPVHGPCRARQVQPRGRSGDPEHQLHGRS